MNLRKELEDLLPLVEKPSRYLGTEWNTVHKDPAAVRLRLCLFFPDLYELGLGNLGLHILYAILNGMDGVWAERAYTPAPDMEKLLRERDQAGHLGGIGRVLRLLERARVHRSQLEQRRHDHQHRHDARFPYCDEQPAAADFGCWNLPATGKFAEMIG